MWNYAPDARKILVMWLFVYEIRFGVCGFGVQHYVETQQKKDTIRQLRWKEGKWGEIFVRNGPSPQLSEGLSLPAASPRTHGCHGDRRGCLLCPLRRKSRPSWYNLGETVVNTFAACSGHQAMTKYFKRESGGKTSTMILGTKKNTLITYLLQ